MLNKQHKQIVLITGASSGIGRSLVIECIKAGHTVIGIARREEKLNELKKEVSSSLFSYYAADVTNIETLKKIQIDLDNKKNTPDIVICSAGIFESDTDPYNPEIIRKTMEINFFGTMNFVELFLGAFLIKKKGHFISLSSVASWRPNLRGISYPASKSAVAMAFRGLNLRYQNDGIRFSTVYLGPVETDMWEGKKSIFVEKTDDVSKKIIKLIIKPKSVSYMPFLSTSLSRISALIPDFLYAKLSSYLFK